MFYQYLFGSLQKQKSRGIQLNIYVSSLINFTKLSSLLTTFVNTQETFQPGLNVVVRVIWHRDVGHVKSMLKIRIVCQRWNLQRRTLSDQRCLFQHWY